MSGIKDLIAFKFQSTLPREERQNSPSNWCKAILFQSTLPREERPCTAALSPCLPYFNPRSHERSDVHFRHAVVVFKISIHAPTRGATLTLSTLFCHFTISIHAPTRGATYVSVPQMSLSVFQSTLPREERQQYCTKNLFIFIQYRQ